MIRELTTPIIEVKNISKIYHIGEETIKALDDISFAIEKGEFVAVIGASGSGKSTLMHILGLLDLPSSGTYLLEDHDVSKISKTEQARIRNEKIGFVFQQFNLLPRTTVLDNVLLPTIYGTVHDAEIRAKEVIQSVGLSDYIDHLSNQLSGGQMQRVAIARALIMNPSIILADEPTGNLDTKRSVEIMELFRTINTEGATVILITHEQDIAKFAQRTITLRDGKIIQET